MKVVLKHLVACILAVAVSPVFACTLAGKSLQGFDRDEYIFIGKVVGFTEPVTFDEKRAKGSIEPVSATTLSGDEKPKTTVGLKIRLIESIYVPKKPVDVYEVYDYVLWSDCSVGGTDLEKLRAHFPLGSEVRVISKEAMLLTEPTKEGTVRLENRPGELGSIALNTDALGVRMTTAASLFDYRSYNYDMNHDPESKYFLPSFEIRKDLWRLESTRVAAERRVILDRLFYAPRFTELELAPVFDAYAESPQDAERRYDSYLMATDPEYYEIHKIFRLALNELVRLGFQKKQAEEAMMKAIEGGTKANYDDLLKETIRILKGSK